MSCSPFWHSRLRIRNRSHQLARIRTPVASAGAHSQPCGISWFASAPVAVLTRSNLHAVEVKTAATQGNSSMKASMKGRDNSLEVPVNLFQSARPPHYMPHARRNRKNQLPFPHPHVGNARSQHVAKRAAINLAWGIEVSQPSNSSRSLRRGRVCALCLSPSPCRLLRTGGPRRISNGSVLPASVSLRPAGAARGSSGRAAAFTLI